MVNLTVSTPPSAGVITDSFSISELSNKERERDGSYSPWVYDKGRKFIPRKQLHGLGTPEEERR